MEQKRTKNFFALRFALLDFDIEYLFFIGT